MNSELEMLSDSQLLEKQRETETKIENINQSIKREKQMQGTDNLEVIRDLIDDRQALEIKINDIEARILKRTKLKS